MRRLIYKLSRGCAFIGSGALLLAALITIISVLGRSLTNWGLSPIVGDYEWVKILVAMSIFYFLPWAELNRSHIKVDIFFQHLHPLIKNPILLFSKTLTLVGMLVLNVALLWQLNLGMWSLKQDNELGFLLPYPVWYNYLTVMPALIILLIVSIYRLIKIACHVEH